MSTQHLLIRSITAADGRVLETGTINALVGPASSGKSESLRDLLRLAGNFEPGGESRAPGEEPKTHVIQDVTFVPKLSVERLLKGITTVSGTAGEEAAALGLGPDLRTPLRRTIAGEWKNILFRPILTARSVWSTSLGEIMPLRVAFLPVEQQLKLLQPGPAASPLRAPESLLQALHVAPADILQQLNASMQQLGYGKSIVLDASERVNLCLRSGATVPLVTGDALADAQNLQKLAAWEEEGDGWKCAAVILLTCLLCQGRVLLLDQPEVYLQPELARGVGAWISDNAPRLGLQVFVVTHDPAFLTGLFAGGSDVSVLRFNRRRDSTALELVPPDIGKVLAQFPLFSAQQAVRCLFLSGVIVTPGEADRIIYQSVMDRILRVHNIGFLHAHGERNLAYVTRALRRAGIPTCAIAELDLFQNEPTFVELIKSLSLNTPPPPWLATRERLVSHVEGRFDERELSASTSEVESFLDQMKSAAEAPPSRPATASPAARSTAAQWERLRRERLAVLPVELRVWVEELLEDLKRIGLFISPKGRLQGWIESTPPLDDLEVWFNRTIQMVDRGEAPAELRAFTAELAAFLGASAALPRTTPTGDTATRAT